MPHRDARQEYGLPAGTKDRYMPCRHPECPPAACHWLSAWPHDEPLGSPGPSQTPAFHAFPGPRAEGMRVGLGRTFESRRAYRDHLARTGMAEDGPDKPGRKPRGIDQLRRRGLVPL